MHKLFEYFIQYHSLLSFLIIIVIIIIIIFHYCHLYRSAPSQKHLRKNLKSIFIALYKPSLNDQKSFDRLMLIRNGIT